jgi:cell division protein FtsB
MPRTKLIIAIICLYLIVTTIQAIFDLWRAGDKQVAREKSLAALRQEQETLLQKKALIETPAYWEKVARDQLGMAKPGEAVVIIPQELLADQAKIATPDASPNWQKWVRLLL